MKINILVNNVYGGWEPTDARLGGTERGVVEWAEELARRHYKVTIYRNGHSQPAYEHNGVDYTDRDYYRGGGDVCLNVKSSEVRPFEPTAYYTNEIDADKLDLSRYKAVIHISQWAKKNIPVNNKQVYVVPHGYDSSKIYPAAKIPKQCLYSSSPDRGLDTLLEAWPKVYAEHPDASLIVTYGVEGVGLPGVICLGDVDEDTMNELYRTSDIWCHPCTGIELQCIAGLKAQASGCWPVIIPAMALSETVKYGTFSNKIDYAQDLTSALTHHPEPSRPNLITIERSTDLLLNVLKSIQK